MAEKQKFINKYEMKSHIELYFSWWLDELQEAGYIEEWEYEKDTFKLSDPIRLSFIEKLITKIKRREETILEKAPCTAYFTIKWTKKAANVFYLDRCIPVKGKVSAIPIRLANVNGKDLISYVETKGNNESSTSSSISFPYKQKWVYQLYGVLIQKVKPFSYTVNSNILFQKTFYPKKVLEVEKYKRDCKYGKKGTSKLKHQTKTLSQFLKLNF